MFLARFVGQTSLDYPDQPSRVASATDCGKFAIPPWPKRQSGALLLYSDHQ